MSAWNAKMESGTGPADASTSLQDHGHMLQILIELMTVLVDLPTFLLQFYPFLVIVKCPFAKTLHATRLVESTAYMLPG